MYIYTYAHTCGLLVSLLMRRRGCREIDSPEKHRGQLHAISRAAMIGEVNSRIVAPYRRKLFCVISRCILPVVVRRATKWVSRTIDLGSAVSKCASKCRAIIAVP